jgi:hypothetical protein
MQCTIFIAIIFAPNYVIFSILLAMFYISWFETNFHYENFGVKVLWNINKILYMDLSHSKMLNLDLNCMDAIFVCFVTTFNFVRTTFRLGKSFILSYFTFKEHTMTSKG